MVNENPNTTRCDLPTLKEAVDNMLLRIRADDRRFIDEHRLANALTPYDEAAILLQRALSAMTDDQLLDFIVRIQRTTANYPQ